MIPTITIKRANLWFSIFSISVLQTKVFKKHLRPVSVLFVFFIAICQSGSLSAANPSYKEKLILTARIYGFMKYYHSEVSVCAVDWDRMTRNLIPKLKADVDIDSFNRLLVNWMDSAGEMARTNMPAPTMSPELAYNLKYDWFNDPWMRSYIRERLDTIKAHFRPHPSCWVIENDYSGTNYGWLIFPQDSAMHKFNVINKMPDETNRVLSVFKYWNIIAYFSPNHDITEKPWDSALINFVLPIASSNNATSYYFNFKKMSAYLDDVHVEGLTNATYIAPPTYYYKPLLVLKHIEGKYTVVKSGESGIDKGFVVNKINGLSVKTMEDSLRKYLSSGNDAVFHRSVSTLILNGYPNTGVNIEFTDNVGVAITKRLLRNTYMYEQFFYSYYPNDSLRDVAYKKIDCGVGYVNMGVLKQNQVSTMYNSLKDAPAIIFDIRNYPNSTASLIANEMFPNRAVCAKFKMPNVEFPGTFIWDSTLFGYNSNPEAYKGKVVVLVDEETQSHAEYTAMILKAFPNCTIVGSQTAGADGNVVYFNLARDLDAGFTGLGVYMPDGTNTQKVGIAVDVESLPTRLKMMAGRDAVLEKGLWVAGCFVSDIESIWSNELTIFPNPGSGKIQVSGVTDFTYSLVDAMGRVVGTGLSDGSGIIDVSPFPNGVYTVLIEAAGQVAMGKLLIVH